MISLSLPLGAQPRGYLQTRDDDLTLLREGMLLIAIGDYGINVDWLDEHDPDGEYVVTVFKGRFDNEVGEGLVTQDAQEVKRFVEIVAAELARPKEAVESISIRAVSRTSGNDDRQRARGFAGIQGVDYSDARGARPFDPRRLMSAETPARDARFTVRGKRDRGAAPLVESLTA